MLNVYNGVRVMNKSPDIIIIHNKLTKGTKMGINCIIHRCEIVLVYYMFLYELKHEIRQIYMLTFIDKNILTNGNLPQKNRIIINKKKSEKRINTQIPQHKI